MCFSFSLPRILEFAKINKFHFSATYYYNVVFCSSKIQSSNLELHQLLCAGYMLFIRETGISFYLGNTHSVCHSVCHSKIKKEKQNENENRKENECNKKMPT